MSCKSKSFIKEISNLIIQKLFLKIIIQSSKIKDTLFILKLILRLKKKRDICTKIHVSLVLIYKKDQLFEVNKILTTIIFIICDMFYLLS